jgi:hypothetical protein
MTLPKTSMLKLYLNLVEISHLSPVHIAKIVMMMMMVVVVVVVTMEKAMSTTKVLK